MAEKDWRGVDEGWGRRAVDFATLSEPANCREYVALHQHLGVGPGRRVLDVACGAGLALELAAARGASVAGIDASPRLIAVARERCPEGDLQVGDMHALPWDDETFDVVTSFRGIWGTTPDAVLEVARVLRPGGRLGLTVWGHIKASPGAWALAPFALAAEPKVANQAAMVSLGRPGAGEELLARCGFVDVQRVEIPFAWEFADAESYARALASTGPAYEAIQSVGEPEFLDRARQLADERVRDGLPLRAEIKVVGYLARKAVPAAGSSFLAEPERTPAIQKVYDDELAEDGYVMNATRLWAHQQHTHDGLFELLGGVTKAGRLTMRQRGLLVTATAAARGDSYCALAWGERLAGEAGADVAAQVLRSHDAALDPADLALVRWARRVVTDPNGIAAADVDELRAAGFDDGKVFAITTFVALRLAFSTVNDALGALPDRALADGVPEPVRAAVTFGRPIADA
jgi:uncharacterized peroxidase-related enzyme